MTDSNTPAPVDAMPSPLTFIADADLGLRLDRWLSLRLPDRPRNQIQNDIVDGRVLVDGEPRPARHNVAAGQRIVYDVPPTIVQGRLLPEAIELEILYEDDDLLVVNKQPGLVVHPAPGHASGTLANALLAHCGPSLEGVGGEGRWGIVHRLDAGTSGAILAAKTQPAHAALTAALADRRIHRQYLGLSIGQFNKDAGSIDRPLGRRPSDRKKMGVIRDGRPSRTDWRVLLQSGGLALLALTLHSGRTHQIRVHLQAIGHPILADETYGWTRKRTLHALDPALRNGFAADWPRRPMLHAARLRLAHPIHPDRPLDVPAPPPKDFAALARIAWPENWPAAAETWLADPALPTAE